VANVSHEIRTPLTVLAGFIETMSHLPLTEVERKRVLELMTQQTQRMQTLVSDLLTLAQLEGSPRPAADRWVPPPAAQVEADARGCRRPACADDGAPGQLAGATELQSAVNPSATRSATRPRAGASTSPGSCCPTAAAS
jgi:two-component system phosphate regulon sensor histidine kinase PhoR